MAGLNWDVLSVGRRWSPSFDLWSRLLGQMGAPLAAWLLSANLVLGEGHPKKPKLPPLSLAHKGPGALQKLLHQAVLRSG